VFKDWLSDELGSGHLSNVLSRSDSDSESRELLELLDLLEFVLSAKETCLEFDLLDKDVDCVSLVLLLVFSPSDTGEVKLDRHL